MENRTENLVPLAHSAQSRCFGCGPANPIGPKLEFFHAPEGGVVCFPALGDSFEGPTGYLHGGILATLLDEAMSKAVRATGVTAVTRNLEVDYHRPAPSSARLRLEGRLVRSEERKHFTEARILDPRGHLLATARGLFIQLRERSWSPGPDEK